jgi:23S rRNA (cytosine1962-C5)-methyltransferase
MQPGRVSPRICIGIFMDPGYRENTLSIMQKNPALILKPAREKSLLRHHPWVFSGAIDRLDGSPLSGDTVEVLSSRGEFLARAAFSPCSQIRARVWTFADEPVDNAFLRGRILTAILSRSSIPLPHDTGAFRLIHAESDGLPGLIVDRYGGTLVVQLLSAGAEFWRLAIAGILVDLTGLTDIYERSDADVRELEGLPARLGPLLGEPPQKCIITENGLQFTVDLAGGHKTGFYLDQRLNRQRVRELSADRDVLDCFCYTGGFSLNALAGGARSVLSVDSSSDALALCRENVALNGLPVGRHDLLEGDVFHLLRKFRDEARSFDLIVLDPPKFAPTAAMAEKAARGYKDINLLGFKLLRPGGLLVTFSCSGGVDSALFQSIVASAALDAGVQAQIEERLFQSPDHPVALNFPEGAYLKGLVCKKN